MVIAVLPITGNVSVKDTSPNDDSKGKAQGCLESVKAALKRKPHAAERLSTYAIILILNVVIKFFFLI